ncbi:MAG: Fic family protein [Gemmatimonadota bacterium]
MCRGSLGGIVDLVRKNPAGLDREAISDAYATLYGEKLSSRTLQRRLEQLIVRQQVVTEGESSSIVYRPGRGPAPSTVQEAGYVPLTAKGTQVRDLVQKPPVEKTPVGYDPNWLFAYKPGKTWYLTRGIRARLDQLGRTLDETRPAGTFARDILGRLLIDLAWASSRLEGNTYTRLDTQNLIEFGQRAEGKDAQEAQMILNHKVAIELLVNDAEQLGFNRATLLSLHAALSESLIGDPADEGRLRERPVNVTGTRYTPSAIPQVIRECFDRILETAALIPDAFEQAFFVMVHIPYLQPFADVNKRTSRLAANLPLIKANLCPLSFVDVPERAYIEGTLGVYEHRRTELLRDVFVWAYERSCAQHRVIRDSVVQPNPLRLRFRGELTEVVEKTVRANEAPRTEKLREWAAAHGIPGPHIDAFAELALSLLLNLNEGSAGRYRLRPSEFHAWKGRFQQ